MSSTTPMQRDDGNQTYDSCATLLHTLEQILRLEIPGDLVEIGCNAGHTSVMIQSLMVDRSQVRPLHLYDSFEGLPSPTEEDIGVPLAGGQLSVTVWDVEDTFAKAGLWPSPNVVIHKGWVENTLPESLPEEIAFAMIDVDLYGPTLHSLRAVYPRLAEDGIILIHDIVEREDGDAFPGVKKAINKFLSEFDGVRLDMGKDFAFISRGRSDLTPGPPEDAVAVQPQIVSKQQDSLEPLVADGELADEGSRQLRVCFATFPYGGNGGIPSSFPRVEKWLARMITRAKDDSRVSEVFTFEKADTPITMTRNGAVYAARRQEIDVLVMVDSDMWPDYELEHHHDSSQVPFWDAAFDFVYDHYEKGPVAVAAPYCGPPPYEMPYVFQWANEESFDPNCGFKLEPYSREQAAMMSGIHPAAALPTGLIMFDVRLFELTEPSHDDFESRMSKWLDGYTGKELTPSLVNEIASRCAYEKYRDTRSWFYYEYRADTDGKCYEYEKASTEDVTATRDISLAGIAAYGYNPIHCAWSSWAGHAKLKVVGKPRLLTADAVALSYRRALEAKQNRECVQVEVSELIRNAG